MARGHPEAQYGWRVTGKERTGGLKKGNKSEKENGKITQERV